MSRLPKYSSNAELIEAIKASDEAAFEKLFYQYYGELKGFLRKKFNLPDEVSRDLIQETFSKIWEKRENLDSNKSVKSFLYHIAKNLAIDYYRKSGKGHYSLPEDIPQDEDAPVAELIGELQTALNGLPESLRQVVVLKWIEGYRYNEIGNLLGISPRTVEGRMAKAFKILVEKLKPLLILAPFQADAIDAFLKFLQK